MAFDNQQNMTTQPTQNPVNEVVENNPENPIELPDGLNLDAVLTKAKKWNSEWKLEFDKKKSKWETNIKIYSDFHQTLEENISTQAHEVWAMVQTIKPMLINSMFTKSQLVLGKPQFNDINNLSYKVNNYVNDMLLESNKGEELGAEALEDFLVLGTSIGKAYWDNSIKLDFDINPFLADEVTPNPNNQEWVPTYQGKPSWENIDLFNFAVDPNFIGADLNKAQWLRSRVYYKKEDLQILADKGEIVELDDNSLQGSGDIDSGENIRKRIARDSADMKKNNKSFVDEFWCTFYYKVDGKQMSGRYYFWLLNNTKIIKFKKNVFSKVPFFAARCFPKAHEFWGLSIVDIIASLSEHIDVTHTQGAYLARHAGEKSTIIEAGAGIDPQQLKMATNGIIVVKDMNKIRTENTTAGADLGVMINYKQSLVNDLSNVGGINDITRGEDPGDNVTTAAATSILNSNGSARMALMLTNFQNEYVAPLAELIFDLSKQFTDQFSLYVENQTLNLTQADFLGSYNWVPQGTTALANRQLRIKTMSEYGQMLATSAVNAAQSQGVVKFPPFDYGKWTMNEVMSLMEVQNPSQYFMQPQPQMPQSGMPNQVNGNGPNIAQGGNGGAPVPNQIPLQDNTVVNQGSELGNMEGSANQIVS